MQNVVYLKSVGDRPADIISIKDFCNKYKNFKYPTVYKWSVIKKEIQPYWTGQVCVSESEVLNFFDKKGRQKWQG